MKLLCGKIKMVWCVMCLVIASIQVQAQVPTEIVLNSAVQIQFVPEEAFFFVTFNDGGWRRANAVLVMAKKKDGIGAQGGNLAGRTGWLIGARISIPRGISSIQYATLVVGKNGNFEFVPVQTVNLQGSGVLPASTQVLREVLMDQKEILASWRDQTTTQSKNLKRLQADAEVIGKFSRVTEVRDEIERLQLQLSGLESDILTLETVLSTVKSETLPSNFAAREGLLTRQMAELVQAAKSAETGELGRKTSNETETQRRLALIESTRNDDFAELQAELEELQRRSAELASEPTAH